MLVRWHFRDPLTSDVYTFEINPADASPADRERTFHLTPTTAPSPEGKNNIGQGDDKISPGTFGGKVLTEVGYKAMRDWFKKPQYVTLDDDLGRSMTVLMTDVAFTRAPARRFPWKHTYTASYLVADMGALVGAPDPIARTYYPTGADYAAGSELTATVVLRSAGAGAGADAVSSIGPRTGDTGVGADAVSSIGPRAGDSGSGSENQSLITLTGAADTGSGTDAVSTVSPAGADTGSGAEAVSLITVKVGDTGSGADAGEFVGTGATLVTSSDTGSGADAVSGITASTTETGSGADASTQISTAGADTGSGSDAPVQIATSGADTSSGADTVSLITPTAGDTGSGADTEAWNFRRSITIDHTKLGSADLTDFPVLISGTYSYLKTVANGGKVKNSSGYDIIVGADAVGSTKLSHEVEKYDPTTGEIRLWVKVPSVSHTSDTVVYLLYGNAGISSDQQDITNVWDSFYKAVYHLGDGSTVNVNDSTGNSTNLTDHGLAAVTGEIGGAVRSNSTSENASGSIGALTFGSGDIITIEAWVKRLDATTGYDPIVTSGLASSDHLRSFHLGFNGQSLGEPNAGSIGFYYNASGTWNVYAPSSNDSDTSSFHHYGFTLTYDTGSTAVLYRDGSAISASWVNGNQNETPPTVDTLYLGTSNSPPENGKAYIDELRISKGVARSASWMQASFNNHSAPSGFYTVGSEV